MLMRSVPPRCRKKSPHSLSSSHRGSPLLRQRERAGGPPGTRGPSAGGGGVLPGPLRPILGGRKGHEAVLGTQVLSAEPVLKTTQAGRRTESLEDPKADPKPWASAHSDRAHAWPAPREDGNPSPFWDSAPGLSLGLLILLPPIRRPAFLTSPFPCKQIKCLSFSPCGLSLLCKLDFPRAAKTPSPRLPSLS